MSETLDQIIFDLALNDCAISIDYDEDTCNFNIVVTDKCTGIQLVRNMVCDIRTRYPGMKETLKTLAKELFKEEVQEPAVKGANYEKAV